MMSNFILPIIFTFLIIFITPFFWAYIFYRRSKSIGGKILCFISPFLIIAALMSLPKFLPESQLSHVLFKIYYHSCFFSYLVGLIFFIIQRLRKSLVFKIPLCLGASLIYLLFFCFYTTWQEKTGAVSSSDNREMRDVVATLQEYVSNHNGILPCYTDEIVCNGNKSRVGKRLLCPINDIPYQWTKRKYVINDDPNLMLVWDSKPHGVLFRWRAVVFIDTLKNPDKEFEIISERKFRKLLKEQQENDRHFSNERLNRFIEKLKEGNADVQRKKTVEFNKKDKQDIEVLIAALKNKDKVIRKRAVWELGELKNTRAVEPLIGILKDEDPIVRKDAALSLEKIGDVRAVEPLIGILKKDEDKSVRETVVLTLGELKDTRAVEPLVDALNDKEWMIRYNAARSLRKIKDNRSVEPLITAMMEDKDSIVRRAAASALGEIGDVRAIKPLISALKDGIDELQENNAVLSKIFPQKQAWLKDANWRVRENAAEALGKMKSTDALESLVDTMMKDEVEFVRSAAIRALGELNDTRAIKSLVIGLKDKNRSIRISSIRALGKIKNNNLITEPLISALRDEYWWARENAAEALGQIKDSRAVESLIAALKDKEWRVRSEVVEALGKIKDVRAIEPLIVALKNKNSFLQLDVVDALVNIGAPAVEPLIATLKDKDPTVREYAALTLGKIGDVRAIESLTNALKDDKWYVRRNAVLALGSIKDMRVEKALVAVLKDDDVDVRYTAEWMLEKIRGNQFCSKGKKLPKNQEKLKNVEWISKHDKKYGKNTAGDDGLLIQMAGMACVAMLGFIFILFIFCILPFICAYKVAQKLKKRVSKILCFVTASLILIAFLNHFFPFPPSLFLFYVSLKPTYSFVIGIIAIFSLLIFLVERSERFK